MAMAYRSMLKENNHPKIGNSAKELGVRVPDDIPQSGQGNVVPQTGGMSVSRHWKDLPSHRIPRRLRALAPDAVGSNDVFCWRFGDSGFKSSQFATNLRLNVTTTTHGNVEPEMEMHLTSYRQALADTQAGWRVDEN